MKFVKLHQNSSEILVNMCIVSEVYHARENKSILYLSVTNDRGEQVSMTVDESLDEIYEKANGW